MSFPHELVACLTEVRVFPKRIKSPRRRCSCGKIDGYPWQIMKQPPKPLEPIYGPSVYIYIYVYSVLMKPEIRPSHGPEKQIETLKRPKKQKNNYPLKLTSICSYIRAPTLSPVVGLVLTLVSFGPISKLWRWSKLCSGEICRSPNLIYLVLLLEMYMLSPIQN